MKDIEKFENFLPEDGFDIICDDATSIITEHENNNTIDEMFSNFKFWGSDVIHQSSIVLIHPIENKGAEKILNDACYSEFKMYPKSYMYYYWTNGSYIPWHDDSEISHACTLYLNKEWDRDWGGYYMYETIGGEIKSIKPEKNLCIMQHNSTPHCTTPVNSGSPYRMSVQMFFE